MGKKLILAALLAMASLDAIAMTDYMCVNDCIAKGYQYGLCVKMCSY